MFRSVFPQSYEGCLQEIRSPAASPDAVRIKQPSVWAITATKAWVLPPQ